MIEKTPILFLVRPSPFGAFAVLWERERGRPRISRVVLSKPKRPAPQAVKQAFPGAQSSSCPEIDDVARQIEAFLEGDSIRFSLTLARLDLCSPFQQAVLRAEHGIPRGCVSTYLRIARHLRRPSGARAVGMALARNPFPIIIPCHRAIRTDGTLGGYQGGLAMKRTLLEMERIQFDSAGRLTTGKYYY
ncbi:MAG: methylated-DNA--[protein]-cysteine S-methyltransferase [Candidatus Eisenbacteria bacterium]